MVIVLGSLSVLVLLASVLALVPMILGVGTQDAEVLTLAARLVPGLLGLVVFAVLFAAAAIVEALRDVEAAVREGAGGGGLSDEDGPLGPVGDEDARLRGARRF